MAKVIQNTQKEVVSENKSKSLTTHLREIGQAFMKGVDYLKPIMFVITAVAQVVTVIELTKREL